MPAPSSVPADKPRSCTASPPTSSVPADKPRSCTASPPTSSVPADKPRSCTASPPTSSVPADKPRSCTASPPTSSVPANKPHPCIRATIGSVPELPEVETIRRQLVPRLRGRRIRAAHSHPSDKFTPARAAVGTTIQDVNRRGKYLIAPLDDGRELIVHLGMTGSLMVSTADSTDSTEDPHIRAWWQLDHDERLVFRDVRRFGRIRCVPEGQYDTIPTLAAQGPDALSPEFTTESLHQALRRSRRRIPTQLLSQKPVAGVGNIYATEALWMAGIHPAERRISRGAATKLHTALVQVLEAGLANGGTTLRDYRDADGGRGNHQNALACYGRSGQPCLRCATPLQHRTYDARTLTFCPQCQSR